MVLSLAGGGCCSTGGEEVRELASTGAERWVGRIGEGTERLPGREMRKDGSSSKSFCRVE